MRKCIVAFSVILALAVAATAGSEVKKMSKKAAKLMTKAETAIRENNHDQAIGLLQQIIPLEPHSAKAHYYLGVLLYQGGKFDESISHIEETLHLQEDYPNARMLLRKVLFDAGMDAHKKQEFAKSNGYLLKVKDFPNAHVGKENENILALTHFHLGFNFFNLKQYPQAQAHFELCLSLEGFAKENLDLYANTLYFLGMIGYIKEQFQDSISFFKKYLALYSGMEKKPQLNPHANYFIGANLFRMLESKVTRGDMSGIMESTREIIPYLESAIAEKLPSEDPHVMLGNCYVYRNEVDKAIQTYQDLIAAFPQSPQLENYKVFLHELQKNRPKGKKK